jgi:hypothetical protein
MSENKREERNYQEPLKAQGPLEEGVKINGLEQVIELLKYADPVFRESLLRRLGTRDPRLAQNLRRVIR